MRSTATGLLLVTVLLMCPAAHADSLWARAENPGNMFADTRARHIGDIVTVLVQEQLLVSNEQDENHKKETTTKFDVNLFRLFGADLGSESPGVDVTSDREHKGSGDFQSQDKVAIRLTATVKETLPNGNLLIEATRALKTGAEERFICLAGIIRPQDISADNTVLSERIADAKISYRSSGPVDRGTKRGWSGKVVDYVWPF